MEAAKCRIADSTFCSFGNGGVILQDLRSAGDSERFSYKTFVSFVSESQAKLSELEI